MAISKHCSRSSHVGAERAERCVELRFNLFISAARLLLELIFVERFGAIFSPSSLDRSNPIISAILAANSVLSDLEEKGRKAFVATCTFKISLSYNLLSWFHIIFNLTLFELHIMLI
jgi:hypothetical protein